MLKSYNSDSMIFIVSLERFALCLPSLELPIALTVTARYQHLLHHCYTLLVTLVTRIGKPLLA